MMEYQKLADVELKSKSWKVGQQHHPHQYHTSGSNMKNNKPTFHLFGEGVWVKWHFANLTSNLKVALFHVGVT